MALAKMYPSLKLESLIRHVKLFLPYFKARIRKFHQNCVVSTDVTTLEDRGISKVKTRGKG
jgi:hypothetical protein